MENEKAARGPSYHDLHITTAHIPRTSIFNLPYGLEVQCSRTSGWRLVDMNQATHDPRGRLAPSRGILLAGEYDEEMWLVLDVAGHVIVDSRRNGDLGNEADPAQASISLYRTKTGKILTNADIERLAEEAERGYDVDKPAERRSGARLTTSPVAPVNVRRLAEWLTQLAEMVDLAGALDHRPAHLFLASSAELIRGPLDVERLLREA